ncbi:MAG: DUF6051 family protein [Prolixibacteraceae bacterium]|jgi:hypothetical protein|nr:DUF6051 family protein [Prolixibacteraceae bacterium]
MSDMNNYQQKMKLLFDGNDIEDQNLGLSVKHFKFSSDLKVKSIKPGLMKGDLYHHEIVEQENPANFEFTYPVILPKGINSFENGILLLHGLNEKSWDKYLAWAGTLAHELQRPIILFPIAYHMNRAPKNWSDPRLMRNVVQSRTSNYKKNESTFANAALSVRLGANPQQFVYSGIQSYYDVWQLLKQIKGGDHELFGKGAKLDFFAYSIGAFLAEILFVCNPGKLLSNSKMFLFAGGPTFDSMMGKSRYIMDRVAFSSLLTLKRKKVLNRILEQLSGAGLPDFENIWQGFNAMLAQRKGRKARKAIWAERGELIYALALEKDKVMLSKKIVTTLKGRKRNSSIRVDVIDFPYDYTHENPFPLNDKTIHPLVNRSFDVVMNKAIRFYLETNKVSEQVFQPYLQLVAQMS